MEPQSTPIADSALTTESRVPLAEMTKLPPLPDKFATLDKPYKSGRSKLPWIAAILIVAILAGAAAYYLYTQNNKPPVQTAAPPTTQIPTDSSTNSITTDSQLESDLEDIDISIKQVTDSNDSVDSSLNDQQTDLTP